MDNLPLNVQLGLCSAPELPNYEYDPHRDLNVLQTEPVQLAIDYPDLSILKTQRVYDPEE